jgi:serine phosphatase RsbU (regulator of sigma subunit)
MLDDRERTAVEEELTGSEEIVTALLEELARAYEEINWFYGLGNILKKEITQRQTFAELFRYIGGLLSIEQANIWVPDAEAGVYRNLVHFDGAAIATNFETIERSEESDRLLRGVGIHVLRSSFDGTDGREAALLPFARGTGFPAMIVSLEAKEQFLGVLLVRLGGGEGALTSSRLKLIAAIGRQVSLYLHIHSLIEEVRANEGLKREIEIAREIQHGLLPRSIPQNPGYDLYAGCITAARVGGDLYDFVLPPGALGMLIADVSGHSVASGLIGMSFRSSFRNFLALGVDMDELFERVNTALHDELHLSGHFLSAFYCTYSLESRRLRYVNAGHNRPFVLKPRTGTFIDLQEAGLLIGILRSSRFRVGALDLEPGDVLILYTDGIVEAENQHQEVFGVERLKAAVRENARRSAKEMYHYLLKEMYLFQDEYFNKDDVTIAVLKIR